MQIRKYLSNCFLLLIPIFLWNILFYDDLPSGYRGDIFEKGIPPVLVYGEHLLRAFLFGLPIIMILSVQSRAQKTGMLVYLIGAIIYFLSWILVIAFPDSGWSQSAWGFTAPAYTPLIWLMGIGLIGNRSFLKIPGISVIYIGLSLVFVLFHTLHWYLVFQRL